MPSKEEQVFLDTFYLLVLSVCQKINKFPCQGDLAKSYGHAIWALYSFI